MFDKFGSSNIEVITLAVSTAIACSWVFQSAVGLSSTPRICTSVPTHQWSTCPEIHWHSHAHTKRAWDPTSQKGQWKKHAFVSETIEETWRNQNFWSNTKGPLVLLVSQPGIVHLSLLLVLEALVLAHSQSGNWKAELDLDCPKQSKSLSSQLEPEKRQTKISYFAGEHRWEEDTGWPLTWHIQSLSIRRWFAWT